MMLRKVKISYYSSLFLLALVITNFLSVNGWCVDKMNDGIVAHIKLTDCHSGFSVTKEIELFKIATSQSTDNKHCTFCHDRSPDLYAVKLFDDFFGSPVSAPSCNSISPPPWLSLHTVFTTLAPGDSVAMATDQSSLRQTQQNRAIRTAVLLI